MSSEKPSIHVGEMAVLAALSPCSNMAAATAPVFKEIARRATPLQQLGKLIDRISKARIVMLGEASHGTHEFYEWRRIITQLLVSEHGFKAICIEGDWPACQSVNKFISGGSNKNAGQVLTESFKRWPTWMWANHEFKQLVEWMKDFNGGREKANQVHLFGLDVYSLFESIQVVLDEVEKIDAGLADKLRKYYACFDPHSSDEEEYLRSLVEYPEGCRKQALQALKELLQKRLDDDDLVFDAQQNARIVRNAENYYRVMLFGEEDSWNVRERHMMETLDLVLEKKQSKMIVWAHNTHIGDYRSTNMSRFGQVNLGGLVREKYDEKSVYLVGFGTYEGSVIASPRWGGPVMELEVPQAREGSYEQLIHDAALAENIAGGGDFYLILDDEQARGKNSALCEWRGNRAIGVVYEPKKERWGNYVPTRLARRYDAFVYVHSTRALKPLKTQADPKEIPETFPSGV